MKKNQKLLVTIGVAIVVVAVAIVVCCNKSGSIVSNEVLIGAILPLTGDFAFEGEKAAKAIMLAEAEINNSSSNKHVKVLLEDGKFTSKDSLFAYNRLMMKRVDGIISFGTPCTGAIKSKVAQDKIPMMAIDGTIGVPQSSPWIFRCLQTTVSVGNAVAAYLNSTSAIRNCALFYMQGDSGDDFAKGVKGVYTGKILGEELFSYDSKDSRASIQKLISLNSDCICVFGYGMGYSTALNQLIELGYRGLVVTDMNVTSILDKLRNNGDGIKYVSLDFGNASENEKSKDFIKRLGEQYNCEPTSFSAFAYEAVRLMSVPVGQTNNDIRNSISRNILGTREYYSVVGVITYQNDGELSIPFSLYSIQNGKECFERKIQTP